MAPNPDSANLMLTEIYDETGAKELGGTVWSSTSFRGLMLQLKVTPAKFFHNIWCKKTGITQLEAGWKTWWRV